MLKIVKDTNPQLKEKSVEVELPPSEENIKIVKQMLDYIKKSQDEKYAEEAAMAKLFASETARDVTCQAVQLFGGYGFTREYPVERMMRDAKITELYGGTSEVQKMVISADLLK